VVSSHDVGRGSFGQ